jgi:hypothetical protein
MKRFTSLMLMLLCAVTTMWAGPTDLPQITTDLENPIYYTIMNTRSSQPGGYMYFAGESVGIKDEQVVTLEDKHMFYFTGSHDALYVHNKATDKKLATIGNGDKAAGSWTAEGTVWAVGVSPKGSGLAFGPKGGLNGNSCWNECNYKTAADKPDFTTWSANDDGSVFVVGLAEESSVDVNSFYTIEAPLFEQVQGVKKGLVVDSEGNLGWNTIDLTNKNHYWVPTQVNGVTVALKNLGTEKYLNGDKVGDYLTSTLKILGQGQYNIVSNGTTVHANNHGSGSGSGSNIVSWGGGIGSASAWQFVEQQDPDAVQPIEITYEFTYNGKVVDGYTQTVNTVTGAEYPNVTVAFPFGVSATKPEGTIAVEDAPAKTITIAVEENLPFVYAASYETINKWYYIQQHSSAGYGKYLQYAETYIEWADATMTAGEADTYTWAFVGDPFKGFKMVNYGAPADANAVVSNGSGNPSFGALADATAWNIKASATNKDAEHFCFQYPGSNQYMNAQSGKIAFWGSADQGSTMWVTERDLTGLADLQALIAQVDAAVAAYGQGGTTVGYYTAESTAALATALAAAKTAAEANTSAAANAAAQTALQNAVAALKTIQPEEGVLYTVKNAYSGVYMNLNDIATATVWNNAALNEVFSFVPATNEGEFYMYNVKRGRYLSNKPGHGGGHIVFAANNTNDAVVVTIKNLGAENRVSITPAGGATIHHDAGQGVVVAWNGDKNSRSAWVVEEVANPAEFVHTLTVGEAGYATLYLACDVVIPETVETYVATEFDEEGNLELTKITGILPANTAVIVKAAAESYTFAYSAEKGTAVTNLLEGTTVNTNIEDDAYVLGNANGIGMYKAKKNQNEGAAWLNNAFKAYLPAPANSEGVKSLSFRFEGEGTTGISEVKGENGNVKTIYDLTGRRIEAITAPGIYIVNGKKVLVK